MSAEHRQQLQTQLWNIANTLRGKMNADEYDSFMENEKHNRIESIIKEERLDRVQFDKLLERYIFTNKVPLQHDVISVMEEQPSILQYANIADRIIDKITDFVNTFLN